MDGCCWGSSRLEKRSWSFLGLFVPPRKLTSSIFVLESTCKSPKLAPRHHRSGFHLCPCSGMPRRGRVGRAGGSEREAGLFPGEKWEGEAGKP